VLYDTFALPNENIPYLLMNTPQISYVWLQANEEKRQYGPNMSSVLEGEREDEAPSPHFFLNGDIFFFQKLSFFVQWVSLLVFQEETFLTIL
jgi:hypothetical protein